MVSKEVIKWSQTVAVDPSEILALPEAARDLVKSKAGGTPKVFVMNPSLTESYGEYSHKELQGKNWSTIFKDAKSAMATAVRDGSFVKADKVVTISDSKVEDWKSSAGSTIKAKLTAIEDDSLFIFETADGKTIRATAAQLSPESVKRAKLLGGE